MNFLSLTLEEEKSLLSLANNGVQAFMILDNNAECHRGFVALQIFFICFTVTIS